MLGLSGGEGIGSGSGEGVSETPRPSKMLDPVVGRLELFGGFGVLLEACWSGGALSSVDAVALGLV